MRKAVFARAYSAHPFEGEEAPCGNLVIEGLFPEAKTLAEGRRLHEENAQAILQVLTQTLPQGTLDQLLLLLFEDKASLLRVIDPARAKGEAK